MEQKEFRQFAEGFERQKRNGVAMLNSSLRQMFETTIKSIESGEAAVANGNISTTRLNQICQASSPFVRSKPLFTGPSAPFRLMPSITAIFEIHL